MTADEIRQGKLSDTELLRELVAQVAELNQTLRERAVDINIVGPVATDVHGIFYAAAAFARRKGKL